FRSMVERASLAQETEERRELELLYYLLAGFAIFVLGRPAHAAGTPFPGGLQVEERDGVFFCPIRDREDDVETAICPFCPAKPSDHNRLPPPG
ncbi:MAG: DUF2115 family protein, partial [Methanomicrobiaceae archaeon]|nr:DUF2115 family protein [Methanomicrobiaceae archaeon]